MKFTRLRIVGFKSFADPVDIPIEPGLTAIVGPNGCGKSNLTEALRWVMGETSSKGLRAGGMDEVIFAGTARRPAREAAEVSLWLDNSARAAPAAFNGFDVLEVSRRIEREGGSTYRVNGREVRARDVQLLFADASSGPRSPALVRQGQIAEIIAAKPVGRRRLLEEAAGIAGLQARRRETDLRLEAAEANLERVADLLVELNGQLESLERQARQARRYRALTDTIREIELRLFRRRLEEARAQLGEAERALATETLRLAERAEAQTAAATAQAVAAHALPGLRENEARAAAALRRLTATRDALDAEERRARERAADLDRRISQLEEDIERERSRAADTDSVLDRLAKEEGTLAARTTDAAAREQETHGRVEEATGALAEHESALSTATAALAEAHARKAEFERTARAAAERLARLAREIAGIEDEHRRLSAESDTAKALDALRVECESAKTALTEAERALEAAEARHNSARETEAALAAPLASAEREAQRLATEIATLNKLLARGVSDRWRPILDDIRVAKGFEAALAAALGDDLDASLEEGATFRWAGASEGADDPALPKGADPIAMHVEAPPALARRLRQIGVVAREEAPSFAALLAPGQRLVTREGELWRWDGFRASADAPSPAARRLAEKNRLADAEKAAQEAARAAASLRARAEMLRAETRAAEEAEREARQALRTTQARITAATERLASAERRAGDVAARLAALTEAAGRLASDAAEARAAEDVARAGLRSASDIAALDTALAEIRARVAQGRAVLAEARAEHQGLKREGEERARRLVAIAEEREQWTFRRATSDAHVDTLGQRLAEARAERDELEGTPGRIREQRLALLAAIDEAEAARAAAADRLAEGEARLAAADRAHALAMQAVAEARESRARSEARLEAARERLSEIERQIREAFDLEPERLAEIETATTEADGPAAQEWEARLEAAKRERERLGAVNLVAENEAAEVEARIDGLNREKTELEEAIRRLRGGIATLTREARERLLAAFETVDLHFRALFSKLFEGGEAELKLIDAEDPLEAGLEILARPPGKKAQSLSLLSGGEQTLTATALIFAVFLTNPAPVCVLDEVDAPLDDHNVERYCDLLDEMTRVTSTRFVVITHNPITMARMHRLFGVTMAERGVSQLVSVDLENAERLVAAA